MGYISVEISFRVVYKATLDRGRFMGSPESSMITEEAKLCVHASMRIYI